MLTSVLDCVINNNNDNTNTNTTNNNNYSNNEFDSLLLL